jgi:asparagine synthase (glutamine-hydrolysing)
VCGIVGIINLLNNSRTDEPVIKKMAESLVHRGPDDFGTYVDDRVAFGHTRLKIIDLSAHGRQPMFDLSKKAGIIFNGEVYNFGELKKNLLDKGYKFKSSTDTEVVLNSYLEYGAGCLDDFVGMFAFAVYDMRKNEFFIARDRIGIKPLYYTVHDGKLIFASEIKAILLYPGFKPEPDLAGISSYMSYRYPIWDKTLYRNVFSLLPGHFLSVRDGRMERIKYWDLPLFDSKNDLGEQSYIEGIQKLFESAVRYRMISDVPLGAYLSGGLDSSMVAAMMSRLGGDPVKTFTIGFEDEGFNEFKFARLVADMYSTDHHEILLSSEDYIENMIKLIRYKDAPLGVANEPALHVMSRKLKEYITVVLSGEGADEIFGGYGRIFRSPYDYLRLKELKQGGKITGEKIVGLLSENLKLKYGDMTFGSELEHFLYLYNYMSWEDKTEFLDNDIISELNHDNVLSGIFESQYSRLDGMDIYDKYMWLFEKIHIVGLLHRVDMTTMATSVEARVPFVDHRLVEYAMSIPSEYKLKWKSLLARVAGSVYNCDQISENYDTPKYILKKAYEKILPPEVIWRKKMGFPVPVHNWFGADFNNFAKELLLDGRAKSRGFYNTENLEKILGNHKLFSDHGFGLKIWMLVNLELWFKEYIDN